MRLTAPSALAVLTVGLASVCIAQPAANINGVFTDGCDLYDQGDFDTAVRHFESLVTKGVRNADVYYNLGNSYYKMGDTGRAVASYRRALLLSPRDKVARANLDLLRSIVGFRDTTSSFDMDDVGTLPLRLASPRELYSMFYVVYYLTVFCFLGVLFFNGRMRMRSLRILVVLLVVTAAVYGFARYGTSRFSSGTEGVIIAAYAEFMSGPGNAFDELATLPDGVEVRLRARSGLWVEVELRTGDIGWVRQDDLEAI
jgi:tetratricopeptide (TPR) repeat protein